MIGRLIESTRSFRFRIAALSTLLSGVVLAMFGTWAWATVHRIGLERLDEDIREIGQRHLAGRQAPRHWASVEESLRFVLGDDSEQPFILLVKGRDNTILHQSETWPKSIAPDSFVFPPESEFEPMPPPPFGDVPDQRPEFRERPDHEPPDGPPQEMQDGRPPRFGGGGPPRLPIGAGTFLTRTVEGQTWRIGAMSNPELTLVLGLNTRRLSAEMQSLLGAFLIAIPVALVLIAVGGWYVAQRALRPVRMLSATAEGITAHGLDRRIPRSGDDAEFDRLIAVFNRMLDRLEKSFHQAVRFSADAAHELKTPLTILQGEIEQALQAAPAGSSRQQTLNTLLEEVQRLKSVVRKLLLLSLADAGELRLNMETLDLTGLLEEAVEDVEVLAPSLVLETDLDSGVTVAGDRDLIRQVLQNLASNAIKYNKPHGAIRLTLRRNGPVVRLSVANTGAGIPQEDRARVFERFYRADRARNRSVDGIGLGLSLANEIARAHQGMLVLEEATEEWTVFTLTLPAL